MKKKTREVNGNMLTVPQYIQARDYYYSSKIRKELLLVILAGIVSAVLLVAGVSWVMYMVERNWIN